MLARAGRGRDRTGQEDARRSVHKRASLLLGKVWLAAPRVLPAQ